MKLKRQGLTTTISELRLMADELEAQCRALNLELDIIASDENSKFQLNIINKTPECSDTWTLEK